MSRSPRPSRWSARQRKLWIWSLAMACGTAALGVSVWWIERLHDRDRADVRTAVSAAFTESALARESPVRFTDVTAESGLRLADLEPPRRRALPEDNGSGLAWGDYNGDGWPDLYVVRHTGGNRLFRNNGDGTFTDVTATTGTSHPADFGMGATWVDYDDDGRLDLYVTNRGPNRLYHNNGDGTFTDVAKAAGVDDPGWGTGVAWGDLDRDGHVDFYLCNYVDYDSDGQEPAAAAPSSRNAYEVPYTLNPNSYSPQRNRLFRNRGDGTFEDVTERCTVADPDGRSLAATFVDLDGDGWLDLYVNNDASPNRLYRNSGAEFGPDSPVTFLDYTAETGTADTRGSMGLSVGKAGDENGTPNGLPDLFVTHWVAKENALYQSLVTPTGRLEYRDKARPFGLGEISIDRVGWGCAFLDLDNDGRVDLAVANGSTLEQEADPLRLKPERLLLFVSDGMCYHDVAPLAGAATARAYNARGLAVADYNHDGRADIAIMTTEGVPVLLRNDTTTGNRSLTVRLKGRASVCFGAKVELRVGGHPQLRWWGADVSYLSMHAPDLLFGLGRNEAADRVQVRWADGKVSSLDQVPAGVVQIDHATATDAP